MEIHRVISFKFTSTKASQSKGVDGITKKDVKSLGIADGTDRNHIEVPNVIRLIVYLIRILRLCLYVIQLLGKFS
jgi:hypothetical protein